MTYKIRDKLMKPRNDRGYSLVEVLVAAAVVAVALVSVVAFVRKGQEMIALEKHRAMARGIIGRTLEKSQYLPDNYDKLPAQPAAAVTTTVVLDPATNLRGVLTLSVGNEQTTATGAVPYRVVTAAVTWTEPGGNNEAVSIAKWLSDVKRN